nr:MaoC family dehydratase [Anaerolineae bacterium]
MKGLELGQKAIVRRIFTHEDLLEYAALTGDVTETVADEEQGKRNRGERPVVPGPLLGGMFSYLLGTRLPGPGTNYLKQRFRFLAPAYLGEEITAMVEITRLRPEKELVNLRTVCTNPAGQMVCEGEALVLVRDVEVVQMPTTSSAV